MEYDALFKRLLKTFFRSFVELFFPEVASQIQWDSIEFLDKEEQSQEAEGQSFHRTADIVVKVSTIDGNEEIILIHVEIEHPWRSTFPFRMFEYFMLLRLSHRLPIFPIAILPERRVKPFEVESYHEGLFGYETLIYNYFHIGLPGLQVGDYWTDKNPISWAFSAFMDRGNQDKIQMMGECYRRVYESSHSDDEKILLLDFIRTYYQLSANEVEGFQSLLRQGTYQEVREMELSYYGKLAQEATEEGLQRGIQQGIQQGIQRGIQQGIQQGIQLTLLQQLEIKFGELPQTTVNRITAIQSQDELTALATQVLTASSLADLGLDGAA